MKKKILFGVVVLTFTCAGLFGLLSDGNLEAAAQVNGRTGNQFHTIGASSASCLTIDRDSNETDVVNVSNRVSAVTASVITFTNSCDEDIDVDMPRFYALSDVSDFRLADNIKAAHFYYLDSHVLDVSGAEMGDDNTIEFNVGLVVPARSTAVAKMTVDIADNTRVRALGFNLDFLSPDFIIKYNGSETLAPFYLTGLNFIKICIAGTTAAPDLRSDNLADWHTAAMSQNDGYDGPLYSPYIPEGGMIRARGDIDVYIVKYSHGKRFKRLILSSSVFKSYGHLKWENIKDVDRAVLNAYTTSDYAYVAGNSTIWRLDPSGDTGTRRNFLAPAISSWNYDSDGVYEINATDRNSYILGPDIVS